MTEGVAEIEILGVTLGVSEIEMLGVTEIVGVIEGVGVGEGHVNGPETTSQLPPLLS